MICIIYLHSSQLPHLLDQDTYLYFQISDVNYVDEANGKSGTFFAILFTITRPEPLLLLIDPFEFGRSGNVYMRDSSL